VRYKFKGKVNCARLKKQAAATNSKEKFKGKVNCARLKGRRPLHIQRRSQRHSANLGARSQLRSQIGIVRRVSVPLRDRWILRSLWCLCVWHVLIWRNVLRAALTISDCEVWRYFGTATGCSLRWFRDFQSWAALAQRVRLWWAAMNISRKSRWWS